MWCLCVGGDTYAQALCARPARSLAPCPLIREQRNMHLCASVPVPLLVQGPSFVAAPLVSPAAAPRTGRNADARLAADDAAQASSLRRRRRRRAAPDTCRDGGGGGRARPAWGFVAIAAGGQRCRRLAAASASPALRRRRRCGDADASGPAPVSRSMSHCRAGVAPSRDCGDSLRAQAATRTREKCVRQGCAEVSVCRRKWPRMARRARPRGAAREPEQTGSGHCGRQHRRGRDRAGRWQGRYCCCAGGSSR